MKNSVLLLDMDAVRAFRKRGMNPDNPEATFFLRTS